jgi:hypothetical protein
MENQIKLWHDVQIGEVFKSEGYVYQKSTSRTAYCFTERRKFTFTKHSECEILGELSLQLEAFMACKN